MERISTGNRNLDHAFEGGFPKGSIISIMSSPMSATRRELMQSIAETHPDSSIFIDGSGEFPTPKVRRLDCSGKGDVELTSILALRDDRYSIVLIDPVVFAQDPEGSIAQSAHKAEALVRRASQSGKTVIFGWRTHKTVDGSLSAPKAVKFMSHVILDLDPKEPRGRVLKNRFGDRDSELVINLNSAPTTFATRFDLMDMENME